MAVRIGSMKKEGMLLYYASLPINKVAFVTAIMLSRLSVTLPGMIAPMLFGTLIYKVDLNFNVWILLLLPLTALALDERQQDPDFISFLSDLCPLFLCVFC